MSTQPACPECNKLSAVAEESQKIGKFLLWLGDNKIELCTFEDGFLDYYPIHSSFENLLAKYFNIDLQKVEQEKQALLDWLREEHE